MKRTLVNRIKIYCGTFVTTIHRRLDQVEKNLVDEKLSPVVMRDQLQVPVCTVNGTAVPREVFADFSPGHTISEKLMEFLLVLLRRRDHRIIMAYSDKFRRSANFVARSRSLFYNAEFFRNLRDEGMDLPDWKGAHQVFITLKSPGCDDWSLLLLDVESKRILFIDPRAGQLDPARLQRYAAILHGVLPRTGLDATEPWRCEVYPEQYFEALSNDEDSGIYLFAIMFFLCAPCPLAFTAVDIVKLRSIFAYYLLSEDLPM